MVEKGKENPFFMLSYHHKSHGVESLFARVVSHLFYSFLPEKTSSPRNTERSGKYYSQP
jgi:hypothetical protein